MTLGGPGKLKLTGAVDIIEHLGESGFAYIWLPSGQTIISEIRGNPKAENGATITVSLDAEQIHIFNAAGKRLA
jgi:ABC-type sugar transport system ATPase subunit